MRCPEKSDNERERLLALKEYGLEDETVSNLDPIVNIAASMFGCPSAAVNIIGDEHVFLASSHGIGDYDPRRDVSFCAHAINQDGVMVVEDATLDPRFHDNPIVTNGFIRFYAGVPLRSNTGHALGALCIIDGKPRPRFTRADQLRLKEVAQLVQDKLELRRLQVAARSAEVQFSAGAASSPNAVLCFNTKTHVTAWNEAATAMFGRTANEMMGRSVFELIAEPDHQLVRDAIARVMGGGMPKAEGTELTGVRASGETFSGELHWSHWMDNGEMQFGAIVRDVTDKKRNREALYQLANYDTLTGLPNRNLFQHRVSEALSAGRALSLIVTDLDNFSEVNSTLGHSVGDAVLEIMAGRIQKVAPQSECVFRIGCDDFVILLENTNDPALGHALSKRVCEAIAEPCRVDTHDIHLSGSCGIALAPDHGNSVEALMGSAELALSQARSRGVGKTFLFIPALRAEAMARRMFEAELHRALEREEFRVFYQPQIRLSDGTLTGAEALIRWQHPIRGLLPPAAFLPALEADSLLTEAVGQWVLKTACAQAAQWRQTQPLFRVSVNLFSAQFRSGRWPQQVFETLKAYDLPHDALELEITENIILDQQDSLLTQLEKLHNGGVTLSFDDFGTGYASLNLLRDYPVSLIKIDKSFTQVVQTSPKDRAIVTFLIDLAHKLGLGVVAEGIEHAEDMTFLRELGCDKGQGYLFSRPVPAAVFTELMRPEWTGVRLAAV